LPEFSLRQVDRVSVDSNI